jgi:hypothetical protein
MKPCGLAIALCVRTPPGAGEHGGFVVLSYSLAARWALTPNFTICFVPDHVLTPPQDLMRSTAGHRSSKTALI